MSRHGSPLKESKTQDKADFPVWAEHKDMLYLFTQGYETNHGGRVLLYGVVWRSDTGWTTPHGVTFPARDWFRFTHPHRLLELKREGRLP